MNATQVIGGVHVDDATIAAFLRDLGHATTHPRMVILEISEKHGFPLTTGRVIANRAGYPDQRRMLRASEEADNRARAAAPRVEDRTPVADRPHPPAPKVDGAEPGDRILEIPLSRIRSDPDNVRDDLTDIEDLAAGIRELGLLQPVVLRPSDDEGDDQLVLVIGHRRRAAFELLGRETIPAIVRGAMLPDEVLAAMLMENGQRVGLNPIEEARGIARLRALTGIQEHHKLAAKVGRSQPYVSGRLALLSLEPADQDAVRNGTMSLARAIAKARGINGTYRAGAQGKASAAHLDFTHRLAPSVENLCSVQLKHSKNKPGRVGDVGCGECWEAVIRSDERLQVQRGRKADTAELEQLRDQLETLRDRLVDEAESVPDMAHVADRLNTLLEGTPA